MFCLICSREANFRKRSKGGPFDFGCILLMKLLMFHSKIKQNCVFWKFHLGPAASFLSGVAKPTTKNKSYNSVFFSEFQNKKTKNVQTCIVQNFRTKMQPAQNMKFPENTILLYFTAGNQ